MEKDFNKLTDLEKLKSALRGYLNNYLSNCFHFSIVPNELEKTLEINIQKNENDSIFIMLRMGISYENEEVYIYNLFLPQEDRGKGIGLGLIHMLLVFASQFNFALILHSIVDDGFYDKMLRRGAIKTNVDDCLEITIHTDLGDLKAM